MNDDIRLIERAQQVCMNLEFNLNIDEVTNFLQIVQASLQNELSINEMIEIKEAVRKCFSKYPDQLLLYLNDFTDNYKRNESYTILTASILSVICQKGQTSLISKSSLIANEIFEMIFPQIEKDELILYDNRINPLFKTSLILDLLYSVDLTSDKIFKFIPFLYSQTILNHKISIFFNFYEDSNINLDIFSQADESYEEIIKYIECKEIKYVYKMNIIELSIFFFSLKFIKSKGRNQIEDISKGCIIIFTALVLLNIQKAKINVNLSNNNLSSIILEVIELLKNNSSTVQIVSIDFLLSNYLDQYKTELISFDVFVQMLEILFKQLINNEYPGNKTILLSAIFKLSDSSQFPNKDEIIKNFFKTNQKVILQYIINNLEEINKSDFNDRLDLNVFDSELFFDYLRDVSLLENIIVFIVKHCCVSKKYFSSHLSTLINEKIKEEQWKEVLLIGKLMQNVELYKELFSLKELSIPFNVKEELFGTSINEDDTIDEILDHILNDPNPERNNIHFLILIYKMIEDKVLLHGYLTYIVTWNYDSYYSIENYLSMFKKEYEYFPEDFVQITNKIFQFQEEENVLLMKTNFNISSLQSTEFGLSIVSNLYKSIEDKPDCFQSFLCLNNISNAFPFLFEENTPKMFDIVFQSFEYISFGFEDNPNSEKIKLLKTNYAAISFLISTLRSPLILDKFLTLIFAEIESFSDSQVYCIFNVLRCLSKYYSDIDRYQQYILKYSFLEKVGRLLQKEIINDEFRLSYKEQIYAFVNCEYNKIQKITNAMILYLNELNSPEYPLRYLININIFGMKFVNGSLSLKFIKLPHEVFDFLYRINECLEFSLYFNFGINRKEKPSDGQINEFTSKLIKDFQHEKFSKELLYEGPITIKMIRYLATIPKCISEHILFSDKGKYIPLSSEMYNAYSQIVNHLNELKNKSENDYDEDDIDVSLINKNDYLNSLYDQELLYENLFQDMINIPDNSDCYQVILNIFDKLMKNKTSQSLIIEIITKHLRHFHENIASNLNVSLLKIISFIERYKNADGLKEKLYDFGNYILDIVLSPLYRNDHDILLKACQLFISYNENNLPIYINHLVAFVFLTRNHEVISEALKIIFKFGSSKFYDIQYLIQSIFKEDIDKHEISNNAIGYIEYLRANSQDELQFFINELENSFVDYLNMDPKNQETLSFICNFFKVLVPSRKSQICFSGVINEKTPEIPQYVMETFRLFWEMFRKHQSLFNELLQSNPLLYEKFTFLMDYPEVINFQIRSSFFFQKMMKKINKKRELLLDIEKSNVFESSYFNLMNIKPEDLLNKLNVLFISSDNVTVDAGGPTREWFMRITKEILNADFGLFDCSLTSKYYQPSRSSSSKKNYLDYFRFIGQIIARGLIQGISIGAQFTISFCKQILNQKPSLNDLEEFDEQLANSLKWILENYDVEQLCRTFVIDIEESDGVKSIPLIENGDQIELTNNNKNEYVDLYVNFVLQKSIEKQINSFCKGFNSLISHQE